MANNTYYKTTIVVTVLSEGPGHYEVDSLAQVDRDTSTGDCVGNWYVEKSKKVSAKKMRRLLIKAGSEPAFFQLDEDDEGELETTEGATP